ncbi:hypothetical protein [Cohnella sp. AR92]|uniref:hypothetical protein n=1 Tax=Cohnella sp. AR92 TaxID=648716 RepID=UPI001315A776|nr:hypothetical protein [Cohnella sp. AR92]
MPNIGELTVKVNVEIEPSVEESIRQIVREEIAAHKERLEVKKETAPYYGVQVNR